MGFSRLFAQSIIRMYIIDITSKRVIVLIKEYLSAVIFHYNNFGTYLKYHLYSL